MPFPLHLFNPQNFPKLTARRVTLVRFVRAVTGVFSQSDAADPDDRGFNLDGTVANAHGPVFGLCGPDGSNPAQQTRIRVMRDRLEPAVQLFPEIVDSGLVTQVSPPIGAPLTPDDTIVVRAARAPSADTSTVLKLHAGSATGPVVGECALRVHPLLTIPIKGHLITINGVAPNSDTQTFQDCIREANKIMVPVGVRFDLQLPVLEESIVGLRKANTVSLTADTHWDAELARVMRTFSQPGVLNAYIVGHIDDVAANGTVNVDGVLGVGISSDFARANPRDGSYVGAQVGFIMHDPNGALEEFSSTLAHEVGHVLRLEHYNNRNGTGPGGVQRNNWAGRNLMFNAARLGGGPPRDQVGYGVFTPPSRPGVQAGFFLGIKTLPRLQQSNQAQVLRTAINDGTFLPI